MARLRAPVEAARVASFAPLSPTATAPVNNPLAIAVVLSPIPIAKLVGVLVQVEPPELPALRPLIDAHVALAAPAPTSAVAARPDATAPRSTPPVTLFMLMWCALPGSLAESPQHIGGSPPALDNSKTLGLSGRPETWRHSQYSAQLSMRTANAAVPALSREQWPDRRRRPARARRGSRRA